MARRIASVDEMVKLERRMMGRSLELELVVLRFGVAKPTALNTFKGTWTYLGEERKDFDRNADKHEVAGGGTAATDA